MLLDWELESLEGESRWLRESIRDILCGKRCGSKVFIKMGVTAHYIDKDWNIQATCLDFLPLSDAHTGSNVHASFVVFWIPLDSSKVLGVTLDNASNNDSFIEKLSSDSETCFKSFFRCMWIIILTLSPTLGL